MAKRKHTRESIRDQSSNGRHDSYVSWEKGEDRTEALEQFTLSLDGFSGHYRSQAHSENFADLDTKTSGRPGLRWRDYDSFRPDEARPKTSKDIILAVDEVYYGEGLIRNIIDLMGDFACQGVRLVHPNKRNEKFFRNWFTRVNGKERSERFLNYLYRTGNVVVRKQTAKIPSKIEKDIFRSVAKPDMQIEIKKVPSREIPWKYTFLHPATIQVVGGSLASFVGQPTYAIKLPDKLRRMIKSPKTPAEKAIVDQLPTEIKAAANTSSPILLPSDKTSVFHYKKDDWQEWAIPMVYSILHDIITIQKMKLADRASLDGAISNLRIIRLGSLEHGIAPNPSAVALLSDILENNTGVGTMDLIWGPDIDILESKTSVHQFLGSEKYREHLNAVYAGLGIPPTLTGTFGAAGTTNNFISLKTLTQRLEYGRDVLRKFWEVEIIAVQKAMGFRLPAKLEFDQTNLADEDVQKRLMIDLADRNIISDERLQQIFKVEPDMERIRLNRELRDREKGAMAPKSGPYYDPQFGVALKKIALQTGVVTPSQVGLRKDEVRRDLKMYEKEKGDEKNALQFRTTPSAGGQPSTKKKGPSGQGRPKNVKDTSKRQTKKFTPRGKASLEVWARAAQEAIADYLKNDLLNYFSKKNMRSLSNEEATKAEEVKFGILCHLEPLSEYGEEVILDAIDKGEIPADIRVEYNNWVSDVTQELNRALTVDELRCLQAKL